jgi:uncharacterized protein YuzE
MEKPKEVTWDYDKEADTLYISFGPPQEALSMDIGAGILARYLEKSGKLVGFTIIGVSDALGLQHHPRVA